MREDFDNKGPAEGLHSGFREGNLLRQRLGSVQHRLPVGNDFIGCSPVFKSILEIIKAVAARRCSVIITGQTGVGKEMVARQIHLASDRADKTFVPVDCTTLTGQLFESQLFGHRRGSFTGAVYSTLGFFRAADGGTIFLDEISEIPLELQAKLLRVLQESIVTPLGSTKSYPVDARVLCSTNCDLRKMSKVSESRRQKPFAQLLLARQYTGIGQCD